MSSFELLQSDLFLNCFPKEFHRDMTVTGERVHRWVHCPCIFQKSYQHFDYRIDYISILITGFSASQVSIYCTLNNYVINEIASV